MRIKSWTTTINNITYNIKYTSSFLKKELFVNDKRIRLQPSKTFGVTRETSFDLGTKTAILVNIDNDCDISIDGYYLDSGEKYIEVRNIPIWNYIFLCIVSTIFMFSHGNICSALFTLVGFYFLIRTSIEPSLTVKKRIIICSVITFSMHLFFWKILYILLSIL
ncbi:hypothetical protein D2A34_15205 [Clostridium chromiireducens]|uniref:Uncharacterized protein n=1 Tax=Clostridium chromiireducens TaxID=225345 RepID=A0A399INA7_9CLOT|nr:hypothetical protein [Clostridium chromiireducens]RII34485.1 hypothetical protein D2A34_15205 [Clostridium chromiireducens]